MRAAMGSFFNRGKWRCGRSIWQTRFQVARSVFCPIFPITSGGSVWQERFSACELGSYGGSVGGSDVFVTNWLQGVVAMVFLYLRWRLVEHLCSILRDVPSSNARRFELGTRSAS